MYTRLNSRRMPSMVIGTDNAFTIAKDKSAVLMKGDIDENGDYFIGPICCHRHAVHVLRNPALGGYSLEVVTPDDGEYHFRPPAKNKLKEAEELAWHYKIFIVRIDLPI